MAAIEKAAAAHQISSDEESSNSRNVDVSTPVLPMPHVIPTLTSAQFKGIGSEEVELADADAIDGTRTESDIPVGDATLTDTTELHAFNKMNEDLVTLHDLTKEGGNDQVEDPSEEFDDLDSLIFVE